MHAAGFHLPTSASLQRLFSTLLWTAILFTLGIVIYLRYQETSERENTECVEGCTSTPTIPTVAIVAATPNQIVNEDGQYASRETPPFIKWPAEFVYPECSRLLSPSEVDRDYALGHGWKRSGGVKRVTLDEEGYFQKYSKYSRNSNFPVEDCEEIKVGRGGFFPRWSLSDEEANFPIAYANIVYKDYAMHQLILATIYQPQNWYCYALDSKASRQFKERMRQLGTCFPNVVIPKEEFDVSSNGRGVSSAHLACMRELKGTRNNRKWKYLVLLQNHDIPLKTNAEMVAIFKILNGTNDVSTHHAHPWTIGPNSDLSFSALAIFKNNANGKNDDRVLQLTKSYVDVSLSRAMVDFMADELDLSGFIARLDAASYNMDENFVSTLNSNDELNAPGGFTHFCLDRGVQVSSTTRSAVWTWYRGRSCSSGLWRHGVCVAGVEDLLRLSQLPHLVYNKMVPSSDWAAVMCWLEVLYNRTHFHSPLWELDVSYYATLPHVLYNQLRKQGGGARPNVNDIECTQEASIYENS